MDIDKIIMNRIPIFDYLRALAIFGIVLCHFCYNIKQQFGLAIGAVAHSILYFFQCRVYC